MFKFPFTHQFIIPTSNDDNYLLLTKEIKDIQQLYYYLYLSCISLPNEGSTYPYYYSFRENKKYIINNDPETFIYNVEGEFVINANFTSDNFELLLPGGVYKLKTYVPDIKSVVVNGGDTLINNNSIETIDDLYYGRNMQTPKSKMIIDMHNVLIDKSIEIHFKPSTTVKFYFYIHIDKQKFVKWYRNRKYFNDDRLSIFDYGSYIEQPNPINIDSTTTVTNADIKKYVNLDNQVIQFDNVKLMRYYNKINVTNNKQLLNYRSNLLDFLFNPYGDFIYSYYFDNLLINQEAIKLDYLKSLYNLDNSTGKLHVRLFISSIYNLTQLYLLRKIPGLEQLDFRILSFNKLKNLSPVTYSFENLKEYNNYLNVTKDVNFDIIITEEDFVCNRFKEMNSIRVPIPQCSNTYCPIIEIGVNYKDKKFNNTYLICDLTIDFNILLNSILISNGNLELWNTNSIEQKSNFLIDSFFINKSPTLYPKEKTINILPTNYYHHFNLKEVMYLEPYNLHTFKLDLSKDVSEVIFLKEDLDDYDILINQISYIDNVDYEISNTTEHQDSIENLGKILYTKYVLFSKEQRNQFNYEFDLLNNQKISDYLQEYYSTNPIPDVYNTQIDNNKIIYTDSNFFIFKNKFHNQLPSSINVLNEHKSRFKLLIKRDKHNHKPFKTKPPIVFDTTSLFDNSFYLHGCNKMNCDIKRNTTKSIDNSNKVYFNNIEILDYRENNYVNMFQNYMDNSDLVCINKDRLYCDIKLDNNYKDIFYKIKCQYQNQLLDIEDFYKVVDKKQPFTLNFNIPNKFTLPLKGNLNQIVTISSSSKNTNIILTNHPFHIDIDEELLYNIDFENIYFKYPYLYIGKLTDDLIFDIRNNDDLNLYIAIYSNPQDLVINYTYNLLYEKPKLPNLPIVKSPRYKRLSHILKTINDTTSTMQNLSYIMQRI